MSDLSRREVWAKGQAPMDDSQREVQRFLSRHGLRYDARTHMLDLVSEIGELAKLVLQASDYGQMVLRTDVDFSGELGDVFYSMLALATALEIDAEDALARALRKYEARLEEGGGPGSR